MIKCGTLEANITRHCMNRCAACSHASPWATPYFMGVETLKRDMDMFKKHIHCQVFYLLGGEPLLHPDILQMMRDVAASGISDQVGILTNGQLLPRMQDEFWDLVDVLRISVYPNLDPAIPDMCRERQQKHKFFLGFDGITSFFKQFGVSPGGASFFDCCWKGRCWTVHEGHFYRCPQAAFWADQFLNLPIATDGLPISEDLTEEKLKHYIEQNDTPYNACFICLSHHAQYPWKMSSSRQEWIDDSILQDSPVIREILNGSPWMKGGKSES